MSQFSNMSQRRRLLWTWGLAAAFAIMCGMIAWSQWYAINVNVPRYLASPGPTNGARTH